MDILLISLILIAAFFAIRLSSKIAIPSLMVFILVGLIFSYFGFEFKDLDQALDFASFSLVIISFYSGLALNLDSVRTSYRESLLLSTIGVIITVITIAISTYFLLNISFVEGLLLGSILGSTDAAGLFSMLRGQDLHLKYDTGPMISFESGANDTFSKSLSFALVATFSQSFSQTALELARLIVFAMVLGLAFSYIMGRLLKYLKLKDEFMYSLFILTGVLFTYGISDIIGANGFLAVYIMGLYLGNKIEAIRSKTLLFFEEAAGIMEIGYFFLLGVFLIPGDFLRALPYAGLVIAIITLLARPLATILILKPFDRPTNQIKFVSFAGFRGSTAIILALKSIHLPLSFDLLQLVFGVVVLSFIIQNLGLKRLAHRLDMIDPANPIHKTFNDYIYETDLGFLQTQIGPGSSWIGKTVFDIHLEENFLVSTIIRDDEFIIPHGDTSFQEGDIVVIGGQVYEDDHEVLDEIVLSSSNPWTNKKVKDINLEEGLLIGLIRQEEILIPTGNTLLKDKDRIILTKNHDKEG